jgi:hypothetical protein
VNLNHFNIYNHWDQRTLVERPPLQGRGLVSLPGGRGRAPVVGTQPAPGSGLRADASGNNVFAGRDGYVYRRGANGWEVQDGGRWRGVTMQSPAIPGLNPSGARAPQSAAMPGGPLEPAGQLYRDQMARSLSDARAAARQPVLRAESGGLSERPASGMSGPQLGLNRPAPGIGSFGGFGRRGGFGGGGFGGSGRGDRRR